MAVSQNDKPAWWLPRMSMFASVKLTILLLVLTAATILIGAWCPQEAAVGRDKVVEQFGPQVADQMIKYGIADIFHSPWFLGLIGLLTVNMVACSVQRVFPKVRSLRQPMPFLGAKEIKKMPVAEERVFAGTVSGGENSTADSAAQSETSLLAAFTEMLRRAGYSVALSNSRAAGHWGKVGRLAPTVTHIGLLLLLAGVTVTSWTGFSGFQPVDLNSDMDFIQSEHSKLWIGKLPRWHVHVDATRRETYQSGDPKQWYSTLSVIDENGKSLKKQEISVNNPLTYEGVDIYQSSWGLRQIVISFNGHKYHMDLRQMGPRVHAAFLPLDAQTIMVFSVHQEDKPIRVFAKTPEWPQPRILTVLKKGQSQKLGAVEVTYEDLVPTTGLQYKCDPGLPMTYTAFGLIMLGVLLAAIPHRQVWVAVERDEQGRLHLVAGGVSKKAKSAFASGLRKNIDKFCSNCGWSQVSSDEAAAAIGAGDENVVNKEDEPCPIFS